MGSLIAEFWLFVRAEQKYWLVPLLVVMGLVAAVVVVAALNPALAPFIYPLM